MPSPRRTPPVNVTIAAVGLGALAAALAQTLIIPVLPVIAQDLGVATGTAQWLLTATLLVAAVSVPVLGRFADMFGRRLMLLVALGGLIAGSVLAAVTSDFALMLAGRAIAGVSAAAIPLGISLMATVLPEERRGSATALVSAMLGVGSALGLPLAGLIGDNADYHVLYWIGAGGALVSFLAILVLVREPTMERQRGVDRAGIVLLVGGLTCLMLGISQGATWGWGSPEILLLFAAAVVLLATLPRVEGRVRNPLIDLPALKRPPVALTNVASLFIGFALFASFTGTANYVQAPEVTGYGFGSSVLTAGLCLAPGGVLMLLLSPASAALMRSWGPAKVLGLSGVILAGGMLFRIVFVDALWQVVAGTTIIGVGAAVGYAALPSLINAHTPVTELAAANGINALARSLGSSLASAVGGALLTAITLTIGGAELPSLDAYRVLFAICGVAALIASAIGFALGARRPEPAGVAIPSH